MREYISAKLHRITVTDASVDYNGSATISADLLEAAGIDAYERIHIVNLNTGGRWDTYALPTTRIGVFELNGGGARLGVIGDRCVVMTYRTGETFTGAAAVFLTETNTIEKIVTYPIANPE